LTIIKCIAFVILLFPALGFAGTCGVSGGSVEGGDAVNWTADSLSDEDVQYCIDNSVTDGDTLNLPAGSATWDDQVSFDAEIHLKGAGIGSTVITHGTGTSQSLVFGTTLGESPRVSNFTLDCTSATGSWGCMAVSGASKTWRIDHMHIKDIRARGIFVDPNPNSAELYGVIDNCIFDDDASASSIAAILVYGNGDSSYTTANSLGTVDAVYIEDNTITMDYVNYDGFTDVHDGGRIVVRYNTITNIGINSHGYDSTPAPYERSIRQWEIYKNTFSATENIARAFHARGGTGVVYHNTITNTGGGGYGLQLNYFCVCTDESSCGWTECTSYPCQDQPGRGLDTGQGTAQALEPVYEWSNCGSGDEDANDDGVCDSNSGNDVDVGVYTFPTCTNPTYDNVSDIVVEDQDYYNDTKLIGYTALTYPHPLRDEAEVVPTNATQGVVLDGTTLN